MDIGGTFAFLFVAEMMSYDIMEDRDFGVRALRWLATGINDEEYECIDEFPCF
jgi:hypothetical protein